MEETTEGLLWLRHISQEELKKKQQEKILLEQELKKVKNELTVSEQRVCEVKMNIRAIQTGYSFRIGRILTYIQRK